MKKKLKRNWLQTKRNFVSIKSAVTEAQAIDYILATQELTSIIHVQQSDYQTNRAKKFAAKEFKICKKKHRILTNTRKITKKRTNTKKMKFRVEL